MSPHPVAGGGPVPEGADPDAYDRLRRRVLWAMPTGLYVIGSCGSGPAEVNLMTANLVVQVATEPKLVAVSIEDGSVTAGLVAERGAFSVSLLDRQDRALVRKFVKPAHDAAFAAAPDGSAAPTSVNGVDVDVAPSGCPVLGRALAWIDCAVRHQVALGSHRLVVGEVTAVGARHGVFDDEAAVLRMEDTRMNYGG